MQGNDDTWRELPLSEGHVAILAGHTLERATCGLIKAAKHKVVCPSHVSIDVVASSNMAHLCLNVDDTRVSTVACMSACSLQSCLQVVGAPGGCSTARNALVYKLRAPDTAVLDLYAAFSKHNILPSRYFCDLASHKICTY